MAEANLLELFISNLPGGLVSGLLLYFLWKERKRADVCQDKYDHHLETHDCRKIPIDSQVFNP